MRLNHGNRARVIAMQRADMATNIALSSEIEPHASIESAEPPTHWSMVTRIAFRFAFVYFLLDNFPFPLGVLPYTSYPDEKWSAMWHAVVPWVGRRVLHLSHPITIVESGSGDRTYDYVLALCFLVLATIAVLVWSILDRKTRAYPRLHQWFRLYIRLALGSTMLSYGAFKVIQAQFPSPTLTRLLEPYGESSPMGLLWTLMGASKGYNISAGAAEMLGGILLFVPQLATLGALISVGVISNIFALNMAYDTPVKLYSFHLLIMAVIVALPDTRRLANVFLFNRKADPAAPPALFKRKQLRYGILALQFVFGLYCVFATLHQSYAQKKSIEQSGQTPLYGIWSVDEFTIDGQSRPPLLTDQDRWQRVIFQSTQLMWLQLMDGTRRSYSLTLDAAKKTLAIGKSDDKSWKADLVFQRLQPDELTLEGKFGGRQITAKLHRTDETKFLLKSRGFHWINERPFNR
jgi:uncharacterized membrane protein YphA (DoxX/SURF4 family)